MKGAVRRVILVAKEVAEGVGAAKSPGKFFDDTGAKNGFPSPRWCIYPQ